MTILSQVTIWQNPETGKITCEVPAGALRRTITLNENDPQSWGEIIKSELDAASDWARKAYLRDLEKQELAAAHAQAMREKIEDKNWERHHQIWDTAAQRRNQGPKFAKKVFGPRNKNQKLKFDDLDLLD